MKKSTFLFGNSFLFQPNQDKEDLFNAVRQKPIVVDPHAFEVIEASSEHGKFFTRIIILGGKKLEKIVFPSEKVNLNLVKRRVFELTRQEDPSLDDILFSARKIGLSILPNWLGPALRAVYVTQPKNEILFIGMDPIKYSFLTHDDNNWDDRSEIFVVHNLHYPKLRQVDRVLTQRGLGLSSTLDDYEGLRLSSLYVGGSTKFPYAPSKFHSDDTFVFGLP